MNAQEDRKTLNISRYSSRRLYNTGAGEYVTADDLARYIREGHDIRVTDKKSGEDITCQILLQIIASQEAEDGGVLPANILMDIIRNNSAESKGMVPKFLSESFDMLKQHRQKISESMREQIANPLDPKNALKSFEAWREIQDDIVKSVLSAWMPKNLKFPEPKNTSELEPNDAKEVSHGEESGELASEIDALKSEMAAMQAKLETLGRK